MKWLAVDTRKMESIHTLLDGFIHIVPESTMQKHWIQMSCWCEPRVHWGEAEETCIVSHRYQGRARGKHPSEIHT